MSDYIGRMKIEVAELNEKIEKLRVFICGNKFNSLEPSQCQLLELQYQTMITYAHVLNMRISNEERLAEDVVNLDKQIKAVNAEE